MPDGDAMSAPVKSKSRNAKASFAPSLTGMVGAALEPGPWKRVRAQLPPLLMARLPRRPPRDKLTAYLMLREALWLRTQASRGNAPDVPMPDVERVTERNGASWTVCMRPAPVVKLDGSRWEGWRYAPLVKQSPFPADVGDEEADTTHLGGSVWWDGVMPHCGKRTVESGRKGLIKFGLIGGDRDHIYLEGNVSDLGDCQLFSSRRPISDRNTWIGCLLERVKHAKSRILEHEAAPHGRDPRKPWPHVDGHPLPGSPELFFACVSGRAHPADVLEDARALAGYRGAEPIPEWIDVSTVAYLIGVASFESGGSWQLSERTIAHALRSRKSFATQVRSQCEALALSLYGRANRDVHRVREVLALGFALADQIGGVEHDASTAFARRALELQHTKDAAKLAARAETLEMYETLESNSETEFASGDWFGLPSTTAPNPKRRGWFVWDPASEKIVRREILPDSYIFDRMWGPIVDYPRTLLGEPLLAESLSRFGQYQLTSYASGSAAVIDQHDSLEPRRGYGVLSGYLSGPFFFGSRKSEKP
jgi:hypothetical protein